MIGKAVLFDLDGTLIDSSPIHTSAFSRAVTLHWKACDVPTRTDLTTQQKMDMIGVPAELREAIQRDTRRTTLDLIPEMVKPDGRLITDFADLSQDHLIGVVTNARRAPAEAMLRAMYLWGYVEQLVTSEDGRHKPEPDLYRLALRRFAQCPRIIAVEDSDAGEQAARRAGLRCLRVTGPEDISANFIRREFDGHAESRSFVLSEIPGA